MEVTTLFIAGLVLFLIFLWFQRTDPRLPPSPRRALPILGHMPYLKRDLRTLFREWRQKCGDIFCLYLGGSTVIVLSGYDLIKEVLVKKADVSSDRPPAYIDQITGPQRGGILFSNGSIWKEHRSTSLSILRAFGMGKNLLAEKIGEEVVAYVDYLKSLKGSPTDIRIKTNISTSNVICSILIGQRFEYNDEKFQSLMHKLGSLATETQGVSLVNFFTWLKYLPGDSFSAKTIENKVNAIMGMLNKFIIKKIRNVQEDVEANNLIDAYLIERNKKILTGVPTTLSDHGLKKIMFDLFGAGTETTSTTISWCILYMLHYPDVQEKIYKEIKENVGTHQTPTIQDKSQLTYLNAVIMETQRLASIVPFSLPHLITEDLPIRGFIIPKGTRVLPNLDSVLHDKTTWGEDALSFRPERFIDVSGKLKNPEEFIPFSTGRRVCLGEAMARMELFLYLSSIFQKCKFLPESSGSVPSLKYDLGIVVQTKPYKVRVTERH